MDSHELIELDKLLQNPWFTRAWVFQEVVASSYSFIKCGSSVILWVDLYSACLSLDYFGLSYGMQSRRNHSLAVAAGTLHEKLHLRKDPAYLGRSLLNIPVSRRATQATDPRDKIFAYVGVSHEKTRTELRPDYSKTLEELYLEVATYLLTDANTVAHGEGVEYADAMTGTPKMDSADVERSHIESLGQMTQSSSPPESQLPHSESTNTDPVSIDIETFEFPSSGLDLLSAAYGMNQGSGLPSWVPDWRLPPRQFVPERNTNGSLRFWAAGCTNRVFERNTSDPRVIGIGGLRFDRIAALSSPGLVLGDDEVRPDPESFSKVFLPGEEWDMMAKKIAIENKYKYTGEDIDVALLESKVAGFTPWGGRLDNDAKITHWSAYMKAKASAHPTAHLNDAKTVEMTQMIVSFCAHHRLMVTEGGFMGLVPQEAAVGDEICILFGGAVPYVLRRATEGGTFRYMGDCYIHGLMNGEAVILQHGIQPINHKWPQDPAEVFTKEELEEARHNQNLGLAKADASTVGFQWGFLWLR